MAQYGFYFDSTRCTGCKTCVLACKDFHDHGIDQALRQVMDYEGGAWTVAEDGTLEQDVFVYHLSMACNHCTNPACVENCPTGAMAKDEETGIVTSDPEVCIGCGTCQQTCPYNAPRVDEDLGITLKCDACKDRVAEGLQPICVEACPLRALQFGTVEEMGALGDPAAIAPMPSDSTTGPNVFFKKAPAVKPAGDTTGFVANVPELL